jgi:hypothetical protein
MEPKLIKQKYFVTGTTGHIAAVTNIDNIYLFQYAQIGKNGLVIKQDTITGHSLDIAIDRLNDYVKTHA